MTAKICFVALNIYPLLSQSENIEITGGAELQQRFIGEGLRDRGFNVSYISMDHEQSDGEIIDNMRVHKAFRPREGVFGLRFFYPRLYKTWRALQRSDADIYYIRCGTFLTAILSSILSM